MFGQENFSPQDQQSIIVRFDDTVAGEGVVSVVIFEIRDEHLGGMTVGRP